MDNQTNTQLETVEKEKVPETAETEKVSMDSHEDYEKSFKTMNPGDYAIGKVVKIENDGVYIDIGYKQEGFIPLNQLSHGMISHPSEVVKVGDELPVVVLKSNDMEGELILSKKRADLETAWRNVTKAFQTGEVVTATVVESVKGGLLVDLGLRGFVPASQVDLRPVKDLSDFVGEAVRLKVVELDRARRKVVLSRKKVLEEERSKMKENTLSNIYEGQIVQGTVARLTNFGAFINLGGVDGLVHISEMAWKRIKHPSDVLKIGQTVDVMVLKVDPKKERISLSIRQALPDPWFTIDKVIQPGSIIKGRVTKIAKNYVFVEVLDGVEGVIPIQELTDKRIAKPEEGVNEGQEIEVKVIEVKKEARRMLLSFKLAQMEGSQQEVSKFTASSSEKTSSGTATIGDILMAKMKAAEKVPEKETVIEEKPEKVEVLAEPKAEVKEEKPEVIAPVAEEKPVAPAVNPIGGGIKPISADEIQKKVNSVKPEATEPEKPE